MVSKMYREGSPFTQVLPFRRSGSRAVEFKPADAIIVHNLLQVDPIKFVRDPRFFSPGADRRLFAGEYSFDFDVVGVERRWHEIYAAVARDPGKFATIPKSMLFNSQQERAAFIQFNYSRYRVNKIQALPGHSLAQKRAMLSWWKKAHVMHNTIVIANLGLELAMAKKWRGQTRLPDTDLVSEGHFALLRAINLFKVHLGWKFSTYGCRCILKQYQRTVQKHTQYTHLFPVFLEDEKTSKEQGSTEDLDRNFLLADLRRILNGEVDHSVDPLNDREKKVISFRFPLDGSKPLTLSQAGKMMDLTKERVRQLQNKALDKMKDIMEDEYLIEK